MSCSSSSSEQNTPVQTIVVVTYNDDKKKDDDILVYGVPISIMTRTIPVCNENSENSDLQEMKHLVQKIQQDEYDPFRTLLDPSVNVELVAALLNENSPINVVELLARFLDEQNVFGISADNDTGVLWPFVLGRLIENEHEQQQQDDKKPWFDVLLKPQTHGVFKHVLGRTHIPSWATLVSHHTILCPHPGLPLDWRPRLETTIFDTKFIRNWLGTPANFSRWLIENQFIIAERYMVFKNHYRGWYKNLVCWNILSSHFDHVEKMEKERIKKEALTRAAANQAMLVQALAPKQLIVCPRSDIRSKVELDNFVHVEYDQNVYETNKYWSNEGCKTQTDHPSSFVEVDFRWIYPVLRSSRAKSCSEGTVQLHSIQRSQIDNRRNVTVRRLGELEMSRIACQATEITFMISLVDSMYSGFKFLRKNIMDFILDTRYFVMSQKYISSANQIIIWTDNFGDDKPERARVIEKDTIVKFVTYGNHNIPIVDELPVSEFA